MSMHKDDKGETFPEEPEDRVENRLPAKFRIWETESTIYCHIWWGREQVAGKRLHEISLLFPYPTRISRGGGIFEEILFIFNNLEVEIEVAGPERGGSNEYADYAQALKRIEDISTGAIISGRSCRGTNSTCVTALTTTVDFLKK